MTKAARSLPETCTVFSAVHSSVNSLMAPLSPLVSCQNPTILPSLVVALPNPLNNSMARRRIKTTNTPPATERVTIVGEVQNLPIERCGETAGGETGGPLVETPQALQKRAPTCQGVPQLEQNLGVASATGWGCATTGTAKTG